MNAPKLALLVLAVATFVAAAWLSAAHADPDAPDAPALAKRSPQAVGNEVCPLMEKPALRSKYAVFRGWRIQLCCGRCARSFAKKFEEAWEAILAETGYDIRMLNVLNAGCPVTGEAIDEAVGAGYNGYYICFADAEARDAFLAAPDEYAEKLMAEVEINVRERYAEYPAEEENDEDEDGADGE